MDEKRKNKRTELKVMIQIHRVDQDSIDQDAKEITVDITDLSMDGIGFTTKEELKLDTFYDANFEIWTKEVLKTVIKVVRVSKGEEHNTYGGFFVGMADMDRFKVNVYQLFND